MRPARGPVAVPVPANGPMRPPTGSSGGVSPLPFNAAGAPPGMRPPSSGGLLPVGMRPPTGSQPAGAGGRPQSGFRPPTGSAGAVSAAAAAFNSASLDSTLTARPVTAAGISGMNSGKPTGPTRQIADKSYWQAELRNRLAALSSELDSMQKEQVSIAKENAAYSQLERRYELVMREVRGLEGELADYNLALDKLRNHTTVEELQSMYERVQSHVADMKGETDEIFLRAGELEAEVAAVDARMDELERDAMQQIRVLGEEKVSEFEQLQAERNIWRQRKAAKLDKVKALNQAIARQQQYMQSPEYQRKQHAQSLQQQSAVLQQRIGELTADLSLANDPSALKERLTAAIKRVNDEVGGMEQQRKAHEAEVEELTAAVHGLEADRDDISSLMSKETRYAAIAERDKKMSQLIDEYPLLAKAAAAATQRLQQQSIAAMQQLVSEKQKNERLESVSAEESAELKDEISFKQNKLKSSAETLATLRKERARRMEELEKIGTLDEKIRLELSSLNKQMETMRDEIRGFRTEEQWKEFHTAERKRLTQLNNALGRDIAQVRQAHAPYLQSVAAARQTVEALEQSTGLRAKEVAWQQLAGEVFELEAFVGVRRKETQYKEAKGKCLSVVDGINARLLDRFKGAAVSA